MKMEKERGRQWRQGRTRWLAKARVGAIGCRRVLLFWLFAGLPVALTGNQAGSVPGLTGDEGFAGIVPVSGSVSQLQRDQGEADPAAVLGPETETAGGSYSAGGIAADSVGENAGESIGETWEGELHLVGRDSENAVLLRWAASSYDLWAIALEKGVVVERHDFDTAVLRSAESFSDTVPPPHKTVFRLPPFKKTDTAVLSRIAEKEPYAAVLGEAVFSTSLQWAVGGENGSGGQGTGFSPWKAISDKMQEKAIRFTLANLAYDRSFAVACLGSMGYADTTVRSGHYYLYRVYVDSAFAGNDTALYFSRRDTRIYVPPLQELQVEYGARMAELRWEPSPDGHLFIGYHLERAAGRYPADKDFVRLNATPYTSLQSEGERGFRYRDSLPFNGQEYVYRVIGLDLFGLEILVAKSRGGQGRQSLSAVPVLDSVAVLKKGKEIGFFWSFPEDQEALLSCFNLHLCADSYQEPGASTLLSGKIPAGKRHVVMDARSLGNSSYLYLQAVGIQGESYFSLPFFFQKADSFPPSPPTGLSYRVDEQGGMVLSWNPSPEKDLAGYRVLVGNSETGEPVQAGGGLLTDTLFFDTLSLHTSQYFYYRVAAEDKRGNLSAPSEALAVKNLLPQKPVPAMFALQHCHWDGKEVELVWYNSSPEYLEGYRLYHRTDTGPWLLVKELPLPSSGKYPDLGSIKYVYPDSTRAGMQFFNIVAFGKGLADTAHAPFLFSHDYVPEPEIPRLQAFADREERAVRLEWSLRGGNPGRLYLYRESETEPLRLLKVLQGGDILAREYRDKNVKMNTRYRYCLQVEDEDGNWSGHSKFFELEY